MSKEEKVYTVQFSRMEIEWLEHHLIKSKDLIDGRIKTYTHPAGKVLTDVQNQEVVELHKHRKATEQFIVTLGDALTHHNAQRLKLDTLKEELQEAVEICEEEEAKNCAREQLKELPANPLINISFDRSTLRFTLKLIENDLQKFRTSIIPKYEKTDASEFKDKIRTKSYYVNKSRRAKNILEKMKIKLEQGL